MKTRANGVSRITQTGTSEEPSKSVQIPAPNFKKIRLTLVGTAPYVQNAFSAKAREMIRATQAAGSTAKGKKKREPKDFDECFQQAQHVSSDGVHGIPAPGFRSAMVSACRTVGFTMTRAKLGFFVEADGFDVIDGTPLVYITKGEPEHVEHAVKNESGVVDLRARPMWKPGWKCELTVRYDADMFEDTDIVNLVARAGMQVGIGEGRPDSRKSCGMGWGLFEIEGV
jgi:hypothetical protein